MNLSHLFHTLIAVCMSILLVWAGGYIDPLILLSFSGAGFYYSREYSQAEFYFKDKLKEPYFTPKVMVEALKIWKWPLDSILDFVCPLLACTGLAAWLYLS